ncbi:hypothetical protein JRQ81_014445 [Phrynocephalus forsythii]|uniref:Uncharacterized protein n=1 Tax=Phrynocephalus forsythii TaxID=171643 RepID=A0A9Q1B3I8_9SAUR|nr:hypothetical protein JRQ81_014445 [Phrynocephalus forsythii]
MSPATSTQSGTKRHSLAATRQSVGEAACPENQGTTSLGELMRCSLASLGHSLGENICPEDADEVLSTIMSQRVQAKQPSSGERMSWTFPKQRLSLWPKWWFSKVRKVFNKSSQQEAGRGCGRGWRNWRLPCCNNRVHPVVESVTKTIQVLPPAAVVPAAGGERVSPDIVRGGDELDLPQTKAELVAEVVVSVRVFARFSQLRKLFNKSGQAGEEAGHGHGRGHGRNWWNRRLPCCNNRVHPVVGSVVRIIEVLPPAAVVPAAGGERVSPGTTTRHSLAASEQSVGDSLGKNICLVDEDDVLSSIMTQAVHAKQAQETEAKIQRHLHRFQECGKKPMELRWLLAGKGMDPSGPASRRTVGGGSVGNPQAHLGSGRGALIDAELARGKGTEVPRTPPRKGKATSGPEEPPPPLSRSPTARDQAQKQKPQTEPGCLPWRPRPASSPGLSLAAQLQDSSSNVSSGPHVAFQIRGGARGT